jgi:hypothetical protein
MESLGYLMLYFLRCRLPWDNVPQCDEQVELIGDMKESTSIEDLCAGSPKEFAEYFRHVKSLGFESRPDYRFLRRMFRNLFIREGYKYDNVFDWTIGKFILTKDSKEGI